MKYVVNWIPLRICVRSRNTQPRTRPTQSIIHVPLQVNRFQKINLLIVQYKYSKSCSRRFYSPESDPLHKNMRYDVYYTTQLCFWFPPDRNLAGGNYLYCRCTSFEKAFRRSRPLNILHTQRICYMFLIPKSRGDWDLDWCTFWVLVERELLRNAKFWLFLWAKHVFFRKLSLCSGSLFASTQKVHRHRSQCPLHFGVGRLTVTSLCLMIECVRLFARLERACGF